MADRCVCERWTPEAAGGRRPASCRTSRTEWAGPREACQHARQRAAAEGVCPFRLCPPLPTGRRLRLDPAGRPVGCRRPLVGRWAVGPPGAGCSWRRGSSAGRQADWTFGRCVGSAVEGRKASAAVAPSAVVDSVVVLASVPLLFCFSAALP